MTGMIDKFRLNGGDEDPGWSVTLNKGTWQSDGTTNAAAKMVWSIDGNKSSESGSWTSKLFDETPNTVAEGGDSHNKATVVGGKFYSEFSGTHRMVGAFGARVQPEQ